MGDKCAATAIHRWLQTEFDIPVIDIIENPNGRTPFMLENYYQHTGSFISAGEFDEIEGLDLYTAGLPTPCTWELNAYLASGRLRPSIQLDYEKSDSIVFAVRSHAQYDERKDMDLDCARETIDQLRIAGHTVEVLYDRRDPRLPDALVLSFDEAIRKVAGAKLFIGGDTGFSHLRAAVQRPLIALYPDYYRWGKASLAKSERISRWWGIDCRFTPFSSVPNSGQMRIVEIGSGHTWSIDEVLNAAE
jgi:hypothetical protein